MDRVGDGYPMKDDLPVGAGETIVAGTLVGITAAHVAVTATAAIGYKWCGVATQSVDNAGGVDGAKSVQIQYGSFKAATMAAADAVLTADLVAGGVDVYADDEFTITKTATGRSKCGKAYRVDVDGNVRFVCGPLI